MGEKKGEENKERTNRLWHSLLLIAMILAVLSIGVNGYVVYYLQGLEVAVDDRAVTALSGHVEGVEMRLSRVEETIRRIEEQSLSAEEIVAQLSPLIEDLELLVAQGNSDLAGVSAQLVGLAETLTKPEPEPIEEKPKNGSTITVLRGDTVWDIARRYQDPPTVAFIQSIMDANNIQNPRVLRVGQVLVIPVH